MCKSPRYQNGNEKHAHVQNMLKVHDLLVTRLLKKSQYDHQTFNYSWVDTINDELDNVWILGVSNRHFMKNEVDQI